MMEFQMKCQYCLSTLDLMIRCPIVLTCGHTLCKKCSIDKSICPIDRRMVQAGVQNSIVIKYIQQNLNKIVFPKKNDNKKVVRNWIISLFFFFIISLIIGKLSDSNNPTNQSQISDPLQTIYETFITVIDINDHIEQLKNQLQYEKKHHSQLLEALQLRLDQLKKKQKELRKQLNYNKRIKNKLFRAWIRHQIMNKNQNALTGYTYSNTSVNSSSAYSKELIHFGSIFISTEYDKVFKENPITIQESEHQVFLNATIRIAGQMTQNQKYEKMFIQFGIIVLIFLIFASASPLQCCNLFISTIVSTAVGFVLIQFILPNKT